jgi:hypothetical protein
LTSISLTFFTATSRAGRATARSASAPSLIVFTSAAYADASASSTLTTSLTSLASLFSLSMIILVAATSFKTFSSSGCLAVRSSWSFCTSTAALASTLSPFSSLYLASPTYFFLSFKTFLKVLRSSRKDVGVT